jgi:hypothetical protein
MENETKKLPTTEEEALAYIEKKKGPWVLDDVPDALRTQAVCEKAVRLFGNNLPSVPLELRTPELCRLALEKKHDDRMPLFSVEVIPSDVWNRELYLLALQNGWVSLDERFDGFDPQFLTFEACVVALQCNAMINWAGVPEDLKERPEFQDIREAMDAYGDAEEAVRAAEEALEEANAERDAASAAVNAAGKELKDG